MNNFTPRAQQVLALARKEAERFNHNYVGTEHLLLGLIRLGQGVAVNVLHKLGLDVEIIRIEVEKQVGSGPNEKMSGNIPYTPRVKKVLALAGKEAKSLGHSYVGTEHILLGILRENDGVAARVLRTLDVDVEKTRSEILTELDPSFIQDPSSPVSLEVNRIKNEIAKLEKEQTGLPIKYSEPMAATMAESQPNHAALKPYLMADEILYWSGVPHPKFRYGFRQLPLLLFMVVFCAFVALIVVGSSGNSSSKTDSSANTPSSTAAAANGSTTTDHKAPPHDSIAARVFLFLWFGGIFGWIAYCWFGLPVSNRLALSKTVYGVTNRRVIAVVGGGKKTVRSHLLRNATDIHLETWTDGSGTISFGRQDTWPFPASRFYPRLGFTLEQVPEAARVFQIISEAATK